MTETKKLPIDQIFPLVDLVAEGSNVVDKIGRTKGMSKYMTLMELIDEMAALGNVDFDILEAQMKDLDNVELVAIADRIKTKLDLVDDELEAIIEDVVGAIVDAISLVKRCKNIAGNVKAKKES